MILNLSHSIFIQNPLDIYLKLDITEKEWEKIWYRGKYLLYEFPELYEYVTGILKKDMSKKMLDRCIKRYEVFLLTQSLLNRKEQSIHITYYPKHVHSFIKDYYHENTTGTNGRDVSQDDREIPTREKDGIQIAGD
jgi:hypothetical protein